MAQMLQEVHVKIGTQQLFERDTPDMRPSAVCYDYDEMEIENSQLRYAATS